MNLTTVSARGAAALVAAVAGAASYEHIYSVAYAAGERQWVSAALPLSIDGLIVVGVAALLEDRRNSAKGRLSARLAVIVGVLATLAANLASAEPHLQARLVAVTAPVTFLIAVEVLTRRSRRRVDADEAVDVSPLEVAWAANAALAAALETDTDDDTGAEAPRSANLADRAGDDAELSEGSPDGTPPGVALPAADAKRIARALRSAEPDMSADMIAAVVRRSPRTVERYLNGHQPKDPASV